MNVICAGMMRSASTWSFNACLHILRTAGRNPTGDHSCSFDRSYSERSDPARDFVFKSHDLDASSTKMLSVGEAKAVCTHRDPLDALVSGASLLGFSFEEMLEHLDHSVRTMAQILDLGAPVLFIAYEDIIDDARVQIVKLADFLEIDLATSEVVDISARTSLQKMKAVADDLEALGHERIVPGTGAWAYDRETLLHRHHVQDAQTGKGYRQLPPHQRQMVYERVREPLSRIGRLLPELSAG